MWRQYSNVKFNDAAYCVGRSEAENNQLGMFYRKSFAIFIGFVLSRRFLCEIFFPFTGYVIEQEKSIAMT
jgi:hypothetical protein